MRKKKDDITPLEAIIGGKARQMDFKTIETVPFKAHEADALTAINAAIEDAKARQNDAQARMQQAQADFNDAQNSLTIANIQQATIFDLVLRAADRQGKQFWFKPEENALVVDPN